MLHSGKPASVNIEDCIQRTKEKEERNRDTKTGNKEQRKIDRKIEGKGGEGEREKDERQTWVIIHNLIRVVNT